MIHPQFDPVIFSLGPLSVQWYGLMYLLGFLAGMKLGVWRAARDHWRQFTKEEVSDLLFYIVLGIIVGGRLGYVFFYQMGLFLADPIYLFKIYEGGMSFHGGFLGVCVSVLLFAKLRKKPLSAVADFVAPLVPPGLFFGRLGNFINGELWGRATNSSWGMIFPQAGDTLLRHPSQIYQMAGEGALLFVVLWWYSRKSRPPMAVTAAFMVGYGVFRTLAEFFRQPDAHIGYLLNGYMTQGMLLSLPMIMIGLVLWVWAYRGNRPLSMSVTKPQARQKK